MLFLFSCGIRGVETRLNSVHYFQLQKLICHGGCLFFMISFSLILAVVAFLYGVWAMAEPVATLLWWHCLGFPFVMKPLALILNIFRIWDFRFSSSGLIILQLELSILLPSHPFPRIYWRGHSNHPIANTQNSRLFCFLAISRILGLFWKAPLRQIRKVKIFHWQIGSRTLGSVFLRNDWNRRWDYFQSGEFCFLAGEFERIGSGFSCLYLCQFSQGATGFLWWEVKF